MEKSIEKIWEEGFLSKDALIAPVVNDLYNRKSIHIIDKFYRMFKMNLKLLALFAVVFMVVSYFVGIPIMGGIYFVAFMALVFINSKLLKKMKTIDKGQNSYQYLKSFNVWLKKMIALNKKIAALMYPIVFMSLVLGFWFKKSNGTHLGYFLLQKIEKLSPDMTYLFGLPIVIYIVIIPILVLLAIFGGRIYEWDLKLVYGRVFKKYEEMMKELELLRA